MRRRIDIGKGSVENQQLKWRNDRNRSQSEENGEMRESRLAAALIK